MRSDAAKVVSERPKSGRTWESKTPRKKKVILDNSGDRVDDRSDHIRQEHQKHRKARFNILDRFLIHRVGCKWDKVYSEICAIADSRSFSGTEIREYVNASVSTDCWIVGRTVMSHDRWGGSQVVRGLYVHPKSRLLSRILPNT